MTFIISSISLALAAALILWLLPRASTDPARQVRTFAIGAVRWAVIVVAGALALAVGIAILFGGIERVVRELQNIGCFNC